MKSLFYGCSDQNTVNLINNILRKKNKLIVIGHKYFEPILKNDFVQFLDINKIDEDMHNNKDCSLIKVNNHLEEFILFCHSLDRKSFYGHFEVLAEHLFKKMCSYAIDFLKINGINKVIFENIPHNITSIVFATACTKLKISFISRGTTIYKNTYVWNKGLVEIKTLYKQKYFCEKSYNNFVSNIQSINKNNLWYELENKKKNVKNYFSHFMLSYLSKYIIFLLLPLKKKTYGKRTSSFYVPNEINKISIMRSIEVEKKKIKILNLLRREYVETLAVKNEKDFPRDFIYFPLHYQPEATTMPMGGEFRDQFSLIFNLSKKLDKNVYLLVKEHPTTFINKFRGDRGRWIGFYKKISELSNVKLVSLDLNSQQLIKNSLAVVTVTGTVALEAALLGKPVGIYGYPWYKRLFSRTKNYYDLDSFYNFNPRNKLMIFNLSLKEGIEKSTKFINDFLLS